MFSDRILRYQKEGLINEKEQWILDYIQENLHANILDKKFVDEYVQKFNTKYFVMAYGADKCPELGRVLSNMHKHSLLQRDRIGLSNMESGFPKWVYVYSLY
jgi:Uri superfamily endonuclease